MGRFQIKKLVKKRVEKCIGNVRGREREGWWGCEVTDLPATFDESKGWIANNKRGSVASDERCPQDFFFYRR